MYVFIWASIFGRNDQKAILLKLLKFCFSIVEKWLLFASLSQEVSCHFLLIRYSRNVTIVSLTVKIKLEFENKYAIAWGTVTSRFCGYDIYLAQCQQSNFRNKHFTLTHTSILLRSSSSGNSNLFGPLQELL